MSPSPEEPVSETGAGGADAGFVVSDEVRAVAAVDDAGSLISDEVRALGAGADREYFETHEGKLINAKGVKARYMRFYSKGSTESALNEYTELEVYGWPAK